MFAPTGSRRRQKTLSNGAHCPVWPTSSAKPTAPAAPRARQTYAARGPLRSPRKGNTANLKAPGRRGSIVAQRAAGSRRARRGGSGSPRPSRRKQRKGAGQPGGSARAENSLPQAAGSRRARGKQRLITHLAPGRAAPTFLLRPAGAQRRGRRSQRAGRATAAATTTATTVASAPLRLRETRCLPPLLSAPSVAGRPQAPPAGCLARLVGVLSVRVFPLGCFTCFGNGQS